MISQFSNPAQSKETFYPFTHLKSLNSPATWAATQILANCHPHLFRVGLPIKVTWALLRSPGGQPSESHFLESWNNVVVLHFMLVCFANSLFCSKKISVIGLRRFKLQLLIEIKLCSNMTSNYIMTLNAPLQEEVCVCVCVCVCVLHA